MTTKEKMELIGKTVRLNVGTIDETEVEVLDVREAYGRQDVQVKNPLSGKTAWRSYGGTK